MDLKRYNKKYFRHKIYDSFIRKTIRSMIDRKRIQKKYPDLQKTYEEKKNDYKHQILPFYERYVNEISNEIMAASLELIIFCIVMCDMIKPKKILDLGSGFSSFAFRFMPSLLKQEFRPEVWSVDDSQEWLNKTKRFLTFNGIDGNHLITWKELTEEDSHLFDFVLYDIGGFPFRIGVFEQAIKFVNENGIMIIDDMHSAEFGLFVQKVLKNNGVSFFDLSDYTKDKLNRYSLLVPF
jgi:predicted O-methyltransferase YrrM